MGVSRFYWRISRKHWRPGIWDLGMQLGRPLETILSQQGSQSQGSGNQISDTSERRSYFSSPIERPDRKIIQEKGIHPKIQKLLIYQLPLKRKPIYYYFVSDSGSCVIVWLFFKSRFFSSKNYVGPHPYSLVPGSDWDLRLLREHRETLALDSGFPARLRVKLRRSISRRYEINVWAQLFGLMGTYGLIFWE